MSATGEFDAIVIGSGMSGGWAAKEFCEKGFKTLVVERGKPTDPAKDYVGEFKNPWDLRFRDRVDPQLAESDFAVQSTCYAFRETTRNFFINDRENPYSVEEGQKFAWIRGDQVGGKSLMWARQSYRWSDIDFEANKQDGYGTDWPIRYGDVEPWYEYVEKFVGVSGSKEGLPQLPDSIFQPPMEMTCVEIAAKREIEAAFKDRKLIIGRTAHLTQPTQEQIDLGRGPCQFRHQCPRGCSFGAYFSSVSATLPAAERTGNLTMSPNTIVETLLYDPKSKRVSGIRVVDRGTGQRREITARVIFLCASTLGTLQLMLNSSSETFPKGFANSSGVLGQYVMDHHHRVGARGVMPGYEDKYFLGRRPNGGYVPRYVNLDNRSDGKFLRGFAFQSQSNRPSWKRALSGQGFGAQLKEDLRTPGPWQMNLQGFGEMLPRKENAVSLHPDKTDAFGIPQLHVNVRFSDNEWAMRKQIKSDAVEMLKIAGCRDVQPFEKEPVPGHCIHEMGGARMGRDPASSVLNAYNQCHDVPNVFATDGSAFASIACQNPSLTFMALTARAVDYASTLMKQDQL